MPSVQGTQEKQKKEDRPPNLDRLFALSCPYVPWTVGFSVPRVSTRGAHFPFAIAVFVTCFFTAGLLYPTSSM